MIGEKALSDWQTVRIFISSTFVDMHAERDHLVRVVFPELKERCRKIRVHLVDVDLRWGVTNKDTQDGKTLDICLDEIDVCRPYFLGLLGHRYGYVPDGHQLSITAREIYHGVLDNELPTQVVDLRRIIEGKLEGRSLNDEQINTLSKCYPWDGERRKYLLTENLSEEDCKIIRSVFADYSTYQRDRSSFFFRSYSLTEELAGLDIEKFIEEKEEVRDRVESLKQSIKAERLTWFEYNSIEAFGVKVLDTLWKQIEEAAKQPAREKKEWIESEAELHGFFMAERTRRFVGRRSLLVRMHEFASACDSPRMMVITGEPGCGKSALMARFSEEIIRRHSDWVVIPHFVGASPDSTSLGRMLRRFCLNMNQSKGIQEELPEDPRELVRAFPVSLSKAANGKRILFIIDALNQIETSDITPRLNWLPQTLPEGVSFVLSTLPGEIYDVLLNREPKPAVAELQGLEPLEIEQLVRDFFGEARKQFPTSGAEEAFLKKVASGNPLYILVALEELRIIPLFEKVEERIASLPESTFELFDQVLERIEGDFTPEIVREMLSLIACGRHGMAGQELQSLLKQHAPMTPSGKTLEKLPDMLWARLHRTFSAYLFERSGVIDFFHSQIEEGVRKRYLATEPDRQNFHHVIADYFEPRCDEPYFRALSELPHHRTKAKDWDGLERVLTDLFFIEKKCASGMTYELLRDYNAALGNLPEIQEEQEQQNERVNKYTSDLIEYSRRGEIPSRLMSSVAPWRYHEIDADTKRIVENPTRADRIRAFASFTSSESHKLEKHAPFQWFCVQQAYNFANSGPVHEAARQLVNEENRSKVLLLLPPSLPELNQHPACLRTLEGHSGDVYALCVTPDGRLAISGGYDKTLRVWDVKTGECLRILEGHSDAVGAVSITPDGRLAISGNIFFPEPLRVWDVKTGECLRILEGHSGLVNTVSITPDGRLAISGGFSLHENFLRVWDVKTGECLRILEGYSELVNTVSITPDGRLAISGSIDQTLRVWNVETGECLRTLEGHSETVNAVSITPDGRLAISGSRDKTLRVWNVETGECLRILEGHSGSVNAVSITPDGRLAISGSSDQALRIWNVETGECLRTLKGHSEAVLAVSLRADGRLAISGSSDKTLRIWNVESGKDEDLWVWEMEIKGKFPRFLASNSRSVESVGITADGRLAISGSRDQMLRVRDAETGQCLRILEGHSGSVNAVSITPDGRLAISGSGDQTLRVWEVESGKDEKWGVWKVDSRQCLRILEGLSGSVNTVSNTLDELPFIPVPVSRIGPQIYCVETAKCLRTLEGHSGTVNAVSITPDGRLTISGSIDQTLRVWNVQSGKCLRILKGHSGTVNAVSITPDGRLAISGNQDRTLQVWEVESGECLRILKGHSGSVNAVSITPDGRLAISGSSDQALRIWNVESGECLRILKGHSGSVNAVSITPDGRLAISGSRDRTLRAWELTTGACVSLVELSAAIDDCCCDGAIIILAVGGDILHFRTPQRVKGDASHTTPVRLFRLFDFCVGEIDVVKGFWENEITTTCRSCGQRFIVDREMIKKIRNLSSHLRADESSCISLSYDAWDEPGLSAECPSCGKALTHNPFIVDNYQWDSGICACGGETDKLRIDSSLLVSALLTLAIAIFLPLRSLWWLILSFPMGLIGLYLLGDTLLLSKGFMFQCSRCRNVVCGKRPTDWSQSEQERLKDLSYHLRYVLLITGICPRCGRQFVNGRIKGTWLNLPLVIFVAIILSPGSLWWLFLNVPLGLLTFRILKKAFRWVLNSDFERCTGCGSYYI